MQRRDNEVTGLGRTHGSPDRLRVTHLTEQDHVRRLSQNRSQTRQVGLGINGDLALRDDRFIVPVQILDRILQCDDMRRPGLVDLIDDAGLRS